MVEQNGRRRMPQPVGGDLPTKDADRLIGYSLRNFGGGFEEIGEEALRVAALRCRLRFGIWRGHGRVLHNRGSFAITSLVVGAAEDTEESAVSLGGAVFPGYTHPSIALFRGEDLLDYGSGTCAAASRSRVLPRAMATVVAPVVAPAKKSCAVMCRDVPGCAAISTPANPLPQMLSG